MSVLKDSDFGIKLCKILKLDPSKTRDIIIENKVSDVVLVKVTQYLQANEADEIIKELATYTLVKEDESSPGDSRI